MNDFSEGKVFRIVVDDSCVSVSLLLLSNMKKGIYYKRLEMIKSFVNGSLVSYSNRLNRN